MTITPQDRQLAERIGKECFDVLKASKPSYLFHVEECAALLAEARDAQHKASWAMAIEAAAEDIVAVKDDWDRVGEDKKFHAADYCESRIRALPTPPITNEGE